MLWETNSKKNTDSKCIVAWGREARAVLVVYRGTASLENVLADLKASDVLCTFLFALHSQHARRMCWQI